MKRLFFLALFCVTATGISVAPDAALAGDATTFVVNVNPDLKFCGIPAFAGGSYANSSQIPTTTPQNIGVIGVCSNYLGFILKVRSANGGELRSTSSNYKLDYKVNATSAFSAGGGGGGYDVGSNGTFAAAFKPSTTPTQIYQSPSNLIFALSCWLAGSCDVGMQWQITTKTAVPAGVYTDVITYTVLGY